MIWSFEEEQRKMVWSEKKNTIWPEKSKMIWLEKRKKKNRYWERKWWNSSLKNLSFT